MSLLKVTPEYAVNVCICGAENTVQISDVSIIRDSVILPQCPLCKDCVSCYPALPYEDSWEELGEESVKRYVMGQHLHFFALRNEFARVMPEESHRKEIVQRMFDEGRYEFVDADMTEITNTVHPLKKAQWERFKLTSEITPKSKQKKMAAPKNPAFKESLKSIAKGKKLPAAD